MEDFFYFISYKWMRLKSFINGLFCAHNISEYSLEYRDKKEKYNYFDCLKCKRNIKLRNR